MDVFVKALTGDIAHKWFDGQWYGWESLGNPPGGAVTSDPDAVSWGNGRIDLFVRGADNALAHKWYDSNGWQTDSTNCKGGMIWTNYPQTQSLIPFSTCRPDSLPSLVAIVREAEATHKHVHAFGSKWSFSDCAFTNDYVIDTGALNRELQPVTPALRPGQQSLDLYHVEAGITIRKAGRESPR